MVKKIIHYFTPKEVDVVVYGKEVIVGDNYAFEPYLVKKIEVDYRSCSYKVMDGDTLVHTSTVFTHSPTLSYLKLKGILIGDCFTSPEYRGQSVYPKMLQYIAFKECIENNKKSAFVFVGPDNLASISGIEKAGFRKIYYFKAKKWLLCFYNTKRINF